MFKSTISLIATVPNGDGTFATHPDGQAVVGLLSPDGSFKPFDPDPALAAYYRSLSKAIAPFGYKKQHIPVNLRRAVFDRDGHRCQHCGSRHDLTVDHIIPEARGGATTLDNCQCLCRSCNSKKGARIG